MLKTEQKPFVKHRQYKIHLIFNRVQPHDISLTSLRHKRLQPGGSGIRGNGSSWFRKSYKLKIWYVEISKTRMDCEFMDAMFSKKVVYFASYRNIRSRFFEKGQGQRDFVHRKLETIFAQGIKISTLHWSHCWYIPETFRSVMDVNNRIEHVKQWLQVLGSNKRKMCVVQIGVIS